MRTFCNTLCTLQFERRLLKKRCLKKDLDRGSHNWYLNSLLNAQLRNILRISINVFLMYAPPFVQLISFIKWKRTERLELSLQNKTKPNFLLKEFMLTLPCSTTYDSNCIAAQFNRKNKKTKKLSVLMTFNTHPIFVVYPVY